MATFPTGRASRTELVVGIIGGGLFAAVGIAVLVFLIIPTLRDARTARDWLATDAFVEATELKRSTGDNSESYQVTASYRYSFDGTEYHGDRVGLMDGGDNIGDWQQRWHLALQQALESGEAITVYVDPANPAESVVDRDIRWDQLGLLLIFPLAFGGAGLGVIAFFVHGYRKGRREAASPLGIEALSAAALAGTPAPAPGVTFRRGVEVPSDARGQMLAFWFFTFLWNLISVPIAFFAIREELPMGNYAALLALVFPLVGLVVLYVAIKRSAEWRRFGRIPLVMDTYPGMTGGEMAGTLDVPLPFGTGAQYRGTLSCLHSHTTGSGKNRSTSETVRWEEEQVPQVSPGPRGTRLNLRFRVPAGLPPSEAPTRSYHLWRLRVKGSMPGVDLDRTYPIEMQPGTATSAAQSAVPLTGAEAPSVDSRR
jgi:hypothetical protein